MKNLLLITSILVITTWVTAQGQESETRNIGSFSGVKVTEGIDVYLKRGDKESVRVEVTGTKLENVITEISGSYLRVHMRDGNYKGNVQAKVYVTYVKVDKLSASSAGSIFSEGTIEANDMEVSVSSAGSIEIALKASSVDASASSAGEIELQGKTKALNIDAASAGQIDAYDLQAEKVDAEAASAGSIKITVTNELNARASSGGNIRYHGNPDKFITDSSSGGSVKKSN
jgi:Putative auto-transporter adhesin, head GIN domain